MADTKPSFLSRLFGGGRSARSGWIDAKLAEAREHREQGRLAEATSLCEEVLRAEPGHAGALIAIADIAFRTGDIEPAIATLRQGLARNPSSAEVHFKLGCLLEDWADLPAAADAYEDALSIDPAMAKAHSNLGAVQQMLGLMDDARASFDRALAADPDFWLARYNIGLWLKLQGRFAEAVDAFQQSMRERRGFGRRPGDSVETLTTHSKLRHDIEQLNYLVARGVLGEQATAAIAAYEDVLRELGPDPYPAVGVAIPAALRPRLAGCYNRLLNFHDAQRIPGGAVNPNLDRERIEHDYFANGPGMTYFDDFLTPDALASLRRFCLESTIWFDAGYSGGYVGSTVEHGFACPLLAQIAEEFRDAFPRIFRSARINGLWGYKYDSERTGISPHADFAAVNVNFWLAPDDATLDPDSGGLVVWDKEAPLAWNFDDYNNNPPRIEAFLQESGAKPYVVPHRQNRVVLFNSNLFHKTDSYRFKPGYENRRINVTILYGERG